MKKNKIAVFVFGIALSLSGWAQAPDGFSPVPNVAFIKNGIQRSSDTTVSITSNFVQEKHLTMMDEVLISRGKFLFKKENHVKWQYTSPIHYAIVINGDEFTINNDGKISRFDTESNKLFKEINNMIVMAIRGDFMDNNNFSSAFYENNTYYLAALTPDIEQLKNILVSIEIYFDKKDFGVRQVRFIESGGDFTLIVFKNRKTNIKIPDNQFKVEHD